MLERTTHSGWENRVLIIPAHWRASALYNRWLSDTLVVPEPAHKAIGTFPFYFHAAVASSPTRFSHDTKDSWKQSSSRKENCFFFFQNFSLKSKWASACEASSNPRPESHRLEPDDVPWPWVFLIKGTWDVIIKFNPLRPFPGLGIQATACERGEHPRKNWSDVIEKKEDGTLLASHNKCPIHSYWSPHSPHPHKSFWTFLFSQRLHQALPLFARILFSSQSKFLDHGGPCLIYLWFQPPTWTRTFSMCASDA